MSGIKRFFAVDKNRSSAKEQPKQEPKDEVVDLANSDPHSDVEVVDTSPASHSPKRKLRKRNPAKEAAPESESGPSKHNSSQPKHEKNASEESTHGSKEPKQESHKVKQEKRSPEEILASIPSAKLPDVDEAAKPNFRQIMQSRAEPSNYGSDLDITAQPNCLTGLTFVVTGQLPTLGREQIQSLIKQYGGHVTGSISGKTSCLVLGDDAGPSKIQKAKKLKLKVLNEDGFLQLLREMPAEGGDSEAAERARAKRKQEEDNIKSEAQRLRRDEHVKSEHGSARKGTGSSSASHSASHSASNSASNSAANSTANYAPHPTLNTETGTGIRGGVGPTEMWTTKYAPRSMNDIVGNTGPIRKLTQWLRDWQDSRKGYSSSEGREFRACMLSGPPGIGKTTAAHLVGKLEGYDVVEYNASDTRSKSLLQSNVAQTLNNSTLGLGSGHKPTTRKLMVIMDEVDGMSAGDRGGVGAMAALARTANVPLVLICNERTLPKMRPFDRCVFDLHFRRPDANQVRPRLLSIAHIEGLNLDANAIDQLTQVTHSDLRQMLNLLETYRTTQKRMSFDKSRSFSKSWNKEVMLKPFDITAKLLSPASQTGMTTNERMDLYFHDYDFAPLMIEENYILTAPSLKAAADASESISEGDVVDKFIHGPQQVWALMPLHDLMSCVMPAFAAAGHARGRFNFTSYLGNNSKGLKYRRLLAELRSHMRLKIAASSSDLRLEMQPLLAFLLLGPLLTKGAEAIPQVIEFMDNYFLTKEDWDVVMELGVGPGNTEDMAKKLPTSVKSGFTRKYNAMAHPLPFMRSVDSKAAAATGRKSETPDLEDVVADDDGGVDEPETQNEPESLDDAMKNDKYIKAKSKPRAKAGAKKTASRKKK